MKEANKKAVPRVITFFLTKDRLIYFRGGDMLYRCGYGQTPTEQSEQVLRNAVAVGYRYSHPIARELAGYENDFGVTMLVDVYGAGIVFHQYNLVPFDPVIERLQFLGKHEGLQLRLPRK